jgi:hypothetical protein
LYSKYGSPYCSVSLFSSPKIRKWPNIIDTPERINAVHELIARQIPIVTKSIITNCGLRDILYNPLVIGLASDEFLKLISAIRNPNVPMVKKVVPIINSIEPILNGVKINNIKIIRPNILAILEKIFCNVVHPSSS